MSRNIEPDSKIDANGTRTEDFALSFLRDAERDSIQLSVAISLKRIADALEGIGGHLMDYLHGRR